jgi:hypothetical protein
MLFCPARQRHRNCDLSPALLLGRDRQCLDSTIIQAADPLLKGIGSDRLRVRASRPERLEPLSSLSIGMDCCAHWAALYNLGFVYAAFPEEYGSA